MQKTKRQVPLTKKFAAVRTGCLLLLSAALSACPPLSVEFEDVHGIYTVIFDNNGGDTEAVPLFKTVRPPATHMDSLPAEPTRAGYRFVEWNTKRDGRGTPFTAQTPVESHIATVVYAQWRPILNLHLPRALVLTPMTGSNGYDEKTLVFFVTVSGVRDAAAAESLALQIRQGNETWFSLRERSSSFVGGVKRFQLQVDYLGTSFAEFPASLHFNLANIPEGYAYDGATHTLLVSTADGLSESRPIPVHQDNLRHFNPYANQPAGRGRYYQLVENVTLAAPSAGQSNWTPVGNTSNPFTGSFDGKGHSISGLRMVSSNGFQGLFGSIGESAQIANLGLEELHVSASGGSYVGGLVGENRGTVQNSYVLGDIVSSSEVGGVVGVNHGTVKHCHSTGSVWGTLRVGGVVGQNNGTLRNSYSTSSVTVASEAEAEASAGGIVGRNDGLVENCYATGDVHGVGGRVGGVAGLNNFGTVRNCYATGNVSGSHYVGGVVGMNRGPLQNSYATGSVRGTKLVGGVAGWHIGADPQQPDRPLHNCVALNPSLAQADMDTAALGRVKGNDDGGLHSNNHARDDMRLRVGNAEVGPSAVAHDLKDGAHVSAGTSQGQYNNPAFWSGNPLGWNFSTLWEWGPTQLPILRNVGGEQNPVVHP